MPKQVKKTLAASEKEALLRLLKDRFLKNPLRHSEISWDAVEKKLNAQGEKLWSLQQMEASGGEPDVIGMDSSSKEFLYCDCSSESPSGRRSLCYDQQALDARKENKPKNNAMDVAEDMGIELLTEDQYRNLQKLGKFDQKTSSWLKTPDSIRKHGGAIFGDFRYDHVFVYHNGVQSYYAARGFRGLLRI